MDYVRSHNGGAVAHVATRLAGTRRLLPGLRSPRGWTNADVDPLHPPRLDPDGPRTLRGSGPSVIPGSARRTEMSVDANRKLTVHEAAIDRTTGRQSDRHQPWEPNAARIAGRNPTCRSTDTYGSQSMAKPPRLAGAAVIHQSLAAGVTSRPSQGHSGPPEKIGLLVVAGNQWTSCTSVTVDMPGRCRGGDPRVLRQLWPEQLTGPVG